jgi:hypothetical protein
MQTAMQTGMTYSIPLAPLLLVGGAVVVGIVSTALCISAAARAAAWPARWRSGRRSRVEVELERRLGVLLVVVVVRVVVQRWWCGIVSGGGMRRVRRVVSAGAKWTGTAVPRHRHDVDSLWRAAQGLLRRPRCRCRSRRPQKRAQVTHLRLELIHRRV